MPGLEPDLDPDLDPGLEPGPEPGLEPPLEFSLPEDAPPMRLDAALGLALPGLGLRARRRLWTWRAILVNGRERPPGFMVRGGDRIRAAEVQKAAPADLAAQIRLVALTADLAALYKPAGLHSAHIQGSAQASLEALLPELWPDMLCQWPGPAVAPAGVEAAPPNDAPTLLTRLDRATSGLVLAARHKAAVALFRLHEERGLTRKTYLALLLGHPKRCLRLKSLLDAAGGPATRVREQEDPDPARHTLAEPLGRAKLAGGYALPDAGGPFTLARVLILRGARHQIRAHLAAAGFPLAGDSLYGPARGPEKLYLHHAALELPGFLAHCPPDWLARWPKAGRSD